MHEDAETEALADELGRWANVTHKKSKTYQPPKSIDIFDQITVRSERELDMVLKQHPTLAAIPESKKIRKALKGCPVELVCAPDETLCLMDSGSTINAAWISKHFPAYADRVQPTPASRNGDFATTAGGQKLMNKGRVVVHATVDDHVFSPAFKDMETELPILSVRKIVRQNNDVLFRQGGGTIVNRALKRTLRFYEYQGVYFIKLKIKDPSDMDIDGTQPPPEPLNASDAQRPKRGFVGPGM